MQLLISPESPEPSTTLEVFVDPTKPCSCGVDKSVTCDRMSTVSVPCRNSKQLSAIRTMFELTIPPAEKEFWSACIGMEKVLIGMVFSLILKIV